MLTFNIDSFIVFLMCFISILCLVWVLFLCTALWSTSVFFKCFINKVWLIDWLMCWCCDPVCWVLTSPWSCPSSRCLRCPCGSCIWCVAGSAGQRGPDPWRPDLPRSGPDSGAWKTAQPAQPRCWRLQTYPDQNTETHTHTHTESDSEERGVCGERWTENHQRPNEKKQSEWKRGRTEEPSNWSRKHEPLNKLYKPSVQCYELTLNNIVF